MNSILSRIVERVVDRGRANGDMTKLPAAYRSAGGGMMNRLALAGVLRLALRFPMLAIVVVLSVIAARVMSRPQRPEPRPAR